MSDKSRPDGAVRSGKLSARQSNRQQSRTNDTGSNTRLQRLPSSNRNRTSAQSVNRLPAINASQEESNRQNQSSGRRPISEESSTSSSAGGTMSRIHQGPRVLDPGANSLRSGTTLHVPRPPGTNVSPGTSGHATARLSPEPLNFPTEESSSFPHHSQATLLSPPLPINYDPSRTITRNVSMSGDLSVASVPLSAEDERMRDLVFHGINHFEQRNKELKEYNSRILKELERLAKENQELHEQFRKLSERFDVLVNENDELKVQNDSKEKESMILKAEVSQFREQATQNWRAKIEVEEKIIKITAENEEAKKKCEHLTKREESLKGENGNLKFELDKKNREMQSLNKTIEELKKNQVTEQNKFISDDDKIETYHQLEQMRDHIKKLKAERENDNCIKREQELTIANLQSKLDIQMVEYKRLRELYMLKTKEFQELHQQTEHLATTLTKKRELLSVSNQPNDTWPPRGKAASASPPSNKSDEVDGNSRVVVITRSPNRNKPARRKSEGKLDIKNLPALQQVSRR